MPAEGNVAAAADNDLHTQLWESFGGLEEDLWNFTGLEGSQEDDWWSSSNAHTRNTAFRHQAHSSPSIDENFSSELPPRLQSTQTQPSTIQPRHYRAASPRSAFPTFASTNTSTFTHQPSPPRQRLPVNREPPRRQPVAQHSENWLTGEERNPTFPDFSSDLFESEDHSSPYGSGIDIDEYLREDPAAEYGTMPATRATNRTRQSRNSIVDLTDSPSSPVASDPRRRPPISLKRSAEVKDGPGSSKRRRMLKPEDDFESRTKREHVEEMDLTNEAPSAEEELAQAQQQELLKAQRAEGAAGPQKMGKRTCIICLDNITNATVTSCGHMFCHECLTQAVLAAEKNSEKGVGGCPVCRKVVNRKKERQMIPIAFMKKSQFKGKARRVLG